MATTEHVLQTLSAVERHLQALTAASRPDQIVRAASNYLESWSMERIVNLQKIDGGWGTFDTLGRPEPLCDVEHIARISNALSKHCVALKDAGIQPTVELLELGLYFSVAAQMAEAFVASRSRSRSRTASRDGYRNWSFDADAKAA